MTKIAFISTMDLAPWGGSEELWSRSALRLKNRGLQVVANVVRWNPRPLQHDALRVAGLSLTTREPRPRTLSSNLLMKVRRRIRSFQPELTWLNAQAPDLVIISQGGNLDGLIWMHACSEAKIPFAVIVQCNSESWWPDDNASSNAARAYKQARRVFCVSRRNRELLEDQIAESLPNATVVWNPLNVPNGPPPPWPSDEGVWRLACVARLEPAAKGQDLLIRVLAMSHWKDRPVELSFFGCGPWENTLKRLANRLRVGNAIFRGHVNNVREIWESHHMFVLPSRFEGLPLALVEAMYCARPATITDVGGSATLCLDGETGFVACAPTMKIVDETLTRAWNGRALWKEMGRNARSRVDQLLPRDQVGDFCDLVLECVGQPNPSRT